MSSVIMRVSTALAAVIGLCLMLLIGISAPANATSDAVSATLASPECETVVVSVFIPSDLGDATVLVTVDGQSKQDSIIGDESRVLSFAFTFVTLGEQSAQVSYDPTNGLFDGILTEPGSVTVVACQTAPPPVEPVIKPSGTVVFTCVVIEGGVKDGVIADLIANNSSSIEGDFVADLLAGDEIVDQTKFDGVVPAGESRSAQLYYEGGGQVVVVFSAFGAPIQGSPFSYDATKCVDKEGPPVPPIAPTPPVPPVVDPPANPPVHPSVVNPPAAPPQAAPLAPVKAPATPGITPRAIKTGGEYPYQALTMFGGALLLLSGGMLVAGTRKPQHAAR